MDPKGPRFVFKPGAIILSQMSQRPILPMAYAASRATLIAWDKFVHTLAVLAHRDRHRRATPGAAGRCAAALEHCRRNWPRT